MSDNVEAVSVPEESISLADIENVEAVSVPEESISLADIQNERDVIFQREQAMKTVLTNALLNWSVSDIKPKLVEWALLGYPNNFDIVRVQVDVLPVCSDGVSRGIHPFIEYCIGCTLWDVVNKFYSKISGFSIAYNYISSSVSICITKV